ncbi:uncharacterized protein LOC131437989 [Malaya genurostris]|uniref:uncharacterized protein LOC131437989 n=1 Tax=Malaya genurostris TaxID=325434 RepID=UPI0026F3880F|nr:uncharacterized protein LOC131437989 [Malaya genurostris]
MSDPPDKRQRSKTYTVYEYNEHDVYPYRVIVQIKNDDNGQQRINKLSLGRLFFKQDEYKRSIENMRALGRNKILVFLKDYKTANKMQADSLLKECNYKVYIPRSFISVTGVVAGVPVDMELEEILENISSEYPILAINRLHRFEAGNKLPTHRISIVFRTSKLPFEVRLYCCINKVRPFINKPIICLNCLRYNHKTDNCRSKKRCGNCSLQHDETEYEHCQNKTKCLYCRDNDGHKTSDENCPERIRQKNIKSIMAKTTLTYVEVKEQNPILTQNRYDILDNTDEFPTIAESYAKMVNGSHKPINQKLYKAQNKRPINEASSKTQEKTNIDKKKKMEREEQQNGVALFNKFRVDDFEKWARTIEEQRKEKIEEQMDTRTVRTGNGSKTVASNNQQRTLNQMKDRSRSRDRPDTRPSRLDWSKGAINKQ